MEGRRFRHLRATRHRLDWPMQRRIDVLLKTPHFGFRLGASEIVERACRLLGSAELPAQISANLRHAKDGFGGDVAVIGHERGDDVDRARALFDRLAGFAIGFQAAKYIFGARRGRVIVDVLGACDRCGGASTGAGSGHRPTAPAARRRATPWAPRPSPAIPSTRSPRTSPCASSPWCSTSWSWSAAT